jgi:hypothetical protein
VTPEQFRTWSAAAARTFAHDGPLSHVNRDFAEEIRPFDPTLAEPLVAVNVEPPARSKRHTSIPPAVSKFLSSTVAKVLVIVLAASVGWLARHLGVAPAEAVKVEREAGK